MDSVMEARRRLLMMGGKPQIEWNGADFTWTDRTNLGQTNNGTAGIATSSSYYKAVLDFIPCDVLADRNISITGFGSVSTVVVVCAFYTDSNEASYIAGSAIKGNNDSVSYGTVPQNAKYCRFATHRLADLNNFYFRTV